MVDCGLSRPFASPTLVVKVRRTCGTMKCKNQTTDTCQECNKTVCGRYAGKKCQFCV